MDKLFRRKKKWKCIIKLYVPLVRHLHGHDDKVVKLKHLHLTCQSFPLILLYTSMHGQWLMSYSPEKLTNILGNKSTNTNNSKYLLFNPVYTLWRKVELSTQEQ